MPRHPPPPRPPPPGGDAESHSQPERRSDTKTSCRPQTQVSPRDQGARTAFPERTDKRTRRPTDGPWDLDTPKKRVTSSAGVSLVSYSLHRPLPWQIARRVSGETLGKLRPPWGAAPRERGFARDPRRVTREGGLGDSLPPRFLSRLSACPAGDGTGYWLGLVPNPGSRAGVLCLGSGAPGAGALGGRTARARIQEKRGPRISRYLSRPRSDSSLGAVARSSDKSPRPAREGAAGPGTARPGARAPPGTEAPRSPTPHSCPGHPGASSSRPNPYRRRTGAGRGGPKKTLPAAAPRGSVQLLIASPQGLRPSRGIPRQLASLAPHGRPLYTQGQA